MKKLTLFGIIIFMLMAMKVPEKTRIIFFGDSITEAGVKPNGYIDLLQQSLQKQGKADKYELIGAGIGGNKVYDLYLRLEEDVLDKKPGIVVLYIGINDVWHKTSSGTGTDLNKFEKFYIALIKKIKAAGSKVVICTPTVIGEKKGKANPQDADLDAYSAVIRKLARSQDCVLVDLRKAFLEYEEARNTANKESGILTTDRVHLNEAGNQLVADQLMKGIPLL